MSQDPEKILVENVLWYELERTFVIKLPFALTTS